MLLLRVLQDDAVGESPPAHDRRVGKLLALSLCLSKAWFVKLLNIHTAKTQLSRLVADVLAGEEVVIAKASSCRATPRVLADRHCICLGE